MATPLDDLNRLLDLQLSNGNWNYDPYMHGMANGLILAQSIMLEKEKAEFLEAPKKWLHDKKTKEIIGWGRSKTGTTIARYK